uniref:C-type lectin domain-containing protein n=1 Tax=Panagrolaimus superbus TaxID=310955 RepID=A0A914Y725_9BILA
MKILIIFSLLSFSYGSSLYEKSFENVKVGKLSQESHPLTFCAICNIASPIPCWECPDIDDLPLCDLVNEYEDYSGASLKLSDHLNSDYNSFKEQCINGQGEYYFGEVTANLNISIGECVKCNIIVKLVKFIQDETLTPGLVKTLEGICPLIKNGLSRSDVTHFMGGGGDSFKWGWTGLYKTNGKWKWTDNSSADNYNGQTENPPDRCPCVFIYFSGMHNDFPCTNLFPAICKMVIHK